MSAIDASQSVTTRDQMDEAYSIRSMQDVIIAARMSNYSKTHESAFCRLTKFDRRREATSPRYRVCSYSAHFLS